MGPRRRAQSCRDEGILAAEIGDLKRAVRLLFEAQREIPGDYTVVSTLASALERSGRPRAAIRAYERALTLRPSDPAAIRNLAGAHLRLALDRRRRGDRSGALDGALRAARIDPFVPDLLRRAARLAVEAGSDGIDAYARALRFFSPEANALGVRAIAREACAASLEAVRSRIHRLKNLVGVAEGSAVPLTSVRREIRLLLDLSTDLDEAGPPLEASQAVLAGVVSADAARRPGATLEKMISLREDLLVPAGLAEVVANLLRNAYEAVGDGGGVRLRAAAYRSEKTGREEIRVEVEDDGPGVRPEDRDRVFEAGYTTKTDGSGWGLFAARRAVEAAGGHLYLSGLSGSTFVVTLPVGP